MDKNKIPLASIKTSLNLDPAVSQNFNSDMGDPQSETKTYLFVAKKVSLDLSNEEVQAQLATQL